MMFDFNRDTPSYIQALYCLLFYILFFVLCYKDYYTCRWVRTSHVPKLSTPVVILFFIFTLTYFVDTDYFHYYQYIRQISSGYKIYTTEPVYKIIAVISNYNYIIFRAIIWGSALWIVYITSKKIALKPDFVLYLLFILYFGLFAYARASLAMSILFLGYCLWTISTNKLLIKFLGFCVMCVAISFHSSMILALGCCLIAPLLKWSKKTIIIYTIAIPIISVLLKLCLNIIISSGSTEAMIINKLVLYSESDSGVSRTILGKIQNLLEILAFVYPIYLISYRVYFKYKISDITKSIKIELNLYKIAFILIAISVAFLNIGLNTEVFSYRIRYMSMLPIVYSLTGLFQKGYIKKLDIQICLLIGFIGTTMGLISAVNHA